MRRFNSTVFGLTLLAVFLMASLDAFFSLAKSKRDILNPISRAEMLSDPVQIAQELAHAEKATTEVINEATFGVPKTLIQFRNLLSSLKDHMAQASNLSDWEILELRNEILGLPNPRVALLLIEIISFKGLLVAVLLAITVYLGLEEEHQMSTSGRT